MTSCRPVSWLTSVNRVTDNQGMWIRGYVLPLRPALGLVLCTLAVLTAHSLSITPLAIRLDSDSNDVIVDVTGNRNEAYRLAISDNLSEWHPLASFRLVNPSANLDDSYGTIAFTHRTDDESQVLYRLSPIDQLNLADVQSVNVTGSANDYRFSVEVSSPDEGCQQYADWWEVLSTEGELLYRRVLLHSHSNEQPFTRSGGPVEIEADEVVWVRAHMNPGGYGGVAFKGSPESGFTSAVLPATFAAEAALQSPQPEDCAF